MSLDHAQPIFFVLTLGAAAALAVANVLERIGLRHVSTQQSLRHPWQFIKSLVRNTPWWIGILLSVVGTLSYYAAMGLYNISLVQPLMALNPMLTAILGWRLLHEHMTRRIGIAIGCVFVGLMLAGTQAGEAPGQLQEITLWVFAVISLAALFVLRKSSISQEVKDAATMGLGFGLSAIFYKSIVLELSLVQAWSWHNLASLQLPCFIGLYALGFIYSQIGLSRGRALFVIPLSSAIGTLIPILGGVIIFAEPFPMVKLLSTLCVLVGTFLFVGGPHKHA